MGSKIRILFIHPSINRPCGPDNSLFELISRLDRNQFDLSLAVPKDSDLVRKYKNLCSQVFILPQARQAPPFERVSSLVQYLWSFHKALVHFRTILNKYKFNLVHANLELCWPAGLAARSLDIPTVTHIRGMTAVKRKRVSGIIAWILQLSADRLIAVSTAVADAYVNAGVDPHRILVINNGVDVSRFHPVAQNASFRNRFGVSVGDPVIASVGSADPRKGWMNLIKACGVITRKYPELKCFFIGDLKIGESQFLGQSSYTNLLRATVESLNLNRNINFTGALSDIESIYAGINILVQPSESEAGPRAVLEALSSGVPVVATDVGGNRSYIQDGINGLLVKPSDELALAQAICEILTDKEKQKRMAYNARKVAEDIFSINVHVESVTKLYLSLLKLPKTYGRID